MSLDPKYVACRTLRHAWEPSLSVAAAERPGCCVLGLVCLRCTTTRVDYVFDTGLLAGRHYTYAEGYLRTKDQPKLSTADYRLAVLASNLKDITIRSFK